MSAWEVFEVVWYTVAFIGIVGLFVYEAFINPHRFMQNRRNKNDQG